MTLSDLERSLWMGFGVYDRVSEFRLYVLGLTSYVLGFGVEDLGLRFQRYGYA